MGRLSGFHVTLRQMCKPRLTTQYPQGQAREARTPARPPRPQSLRGRHGEVHRLRAVRGRVPGALHLRAGCRQPYRRPGLARRALRLRLRDQLSAVHPLRSVRGGVPDRGDHRDRSCSSSRSPTAPMPSTRRTSSSSTTRVVRSGCRGSCGPAAKTTTPACGCARPHRRGRPATKVGSAGPASSASVCDPRSTASVREPRRSMPTS